MKKGFTLLEILVAMFVLSVVLVTVYQTFQIVIESTQHARELQKETHVARMVLSMMARDLESAYWEEASLESDVGEDEETGGDEMVSEALPQFLVESIDKEGDPWDRITFLSLGPAWGPFRVSSSRVHEVEYRLAKDPETEKALLVRREDPTPDEDLLTGGEEWLLADSVRAFEVICVTEEGETNESWDSRSDASLPRSVILSLWVWNPEKPEVAPANYTLRVTLPPYGGFVG